MSDLPKTDAEAAAAWLKEDWHRGVVDGGGYNLDISDKVAEAFVAGCQSMRPSPPEDQSADHGAHRVGCKVIWRDHPQSEPVELEILEWCPGTPGSRNHGWYVAMSTEFRQRRILRYADFRPYTHANATWA